MMAHGELEATVETAGGVLPAAIVTGQTTAAGVDRADAAERVIGRPGTGKRADGSPAAGERQGVAAAFAGDAEVRAGLLPFRAVGGEAAFFRAGMGDQVRRVRGGGCGRSRPGSRANGG